MEKQRTARAGQARRSKAYRLRVKQRRAEAAKQKAEGRTDEVKVDELNAEFEQLLAEIKSDISAREAGCPGAADASRFCKASNKKLGALASQSVVAHSTAGTALSKSSGELSRLASEEDDDHVE